MALDKSLSISEAASVSGVGQDKIEDMISRGILPCYFVMSEVRIVFASDLYDATATPSDASKEVDS